MIYLRLSGRQKDGKLSSIGPGNLPCIDQTQTKASIYELYIRIVGSNTDRLQLMLIRQNDYFVAYKRGSCFLRNSLS